ncbi:MAG: peptidase M16 [Niastella sp. SCN 39-18]|nr:MAG: peptidase M16 [Niastella sp. SCN 39-18]OJW09321.1 MAG: peptidase M16 [Sphingobacteriales bacterium 39-19]
MLNRKIAPPIVDAVNFNLQLKPYQYFTLENGIPVYCIDAGEQEVLQIEWVFYAGNWFEQQQGVAAATNFMLKNGTSKKNAYELNEAFDYYGSYCSRSCYNETASVSLHCLSRHAEKGVSIIAEMISDSVFPEKELEIFKQNSKQRLQVNQKKCEFVAGRKIDGLLYGEKHPYAAYTSETEIDALDVALLKTFYQQYYLQGSCVIFVAGKLPAQIIGLLNAHFGKMPLKKPGYLLSPVPVNPSPEKKWRIKNDEQAVQGAIRMASSFPNRHHPDFKKAVVLNNIFGGYFGSRLMSNIREEKGYTYGIYSYLQNHIQESAWMISTEAGLAYCEPLIEEVYKEMKLLRETPVSSNELKLVQNYMMGSLLGDLDGPFHIIAKWKNIILNGLGEDYFYSSVDAIKNSKPEELQALAQKYLQPENFYELIVY